MSVVSLRRFAPATAVLVAIAAFCSAGSVAHAQTNVSLTVSNPGDLADGADLSGTQPGLSRFYLTGNNQAGAILGTPSISLNINHDYVGDLAAFLRYVPNDINQPVIDVPLFVEISDDQFTLENNLAGTYSFSNLATQTLQDAAQPDDTNAVVPNGTYLPSNFYFEGGVPPVADLTTAFNGQSLANGSFQLLIQDYFQGGTGSLSSATLNLTYATPEPASLTALAGIGATLLRRRRR